MPGLHGEQVDEAARLRGMARPQNDYFDRLHRRLLDDGYPPHEALRAVFEAYLDGKPPQPTMRLSPTRAERDRWFWSSGFVGVCSGRDWGSDAGRATDDRGMTGQARSNVVDVGPSPASLAASAFVSAGPATMEHWHIKGRMRRP